MTQLAERLCHLASSGQMVSFGNLGLPEIVVHAEAAEVAAGPYAPLLAEAITHAFDNDGHMWTSVAAVFSSGFVKQPSVLHLTSALETLLGSTTTAKAMAKNFSGALLTDLSEAVQSMPLLAAARLEGAVRLAVSDAVSPIKVWGTLEELDTDGPEAFLERLPRILGLALDCWSQDEQVISEALRSLLGELAHDEASDVDAFVELGCDQLRSALCAQSLTQVSEHITAARSWFSAAEAAEEARHDAQVYAAVCDAILAFTARDATLVGGAADRIEMALQQRDAWHWGMHQPLWLRPQLAAEVAWGRLVLRLRQASDLLQEDVWMEPWSALGDVLSAYSASRTVRPFGRAGDGPGLALLVEPAVEDSFLRQQALLAQLRRAATAPDQHPGLGFDRETASILLAAIDRRLALGAAQTGRESRTPTSDSTEEGVSGEPDVERAYRFAPTVVRKLGIDFTAGIARDVSDEALARIDGLTHTEDLARLRNSDAVIVPLLNRVVEQLTAFPDFVGETRRTFSLLVEQTLLFLKVAADLDTATAFGEGRFDTAGKRIRIRDCRRRFNKSDGDAVPVENDLQQHFHYWLLSGQLSSLVQVETIRALGRADVLVHFGSRQYLTEIKKTHANSTRDYLEGKFLVQAAEYSNTNVPFGQLLVLDLTEKTKVGTLRVDELAWVTSHRPPGASTDRAVFAGVVTGNRYIPSDFS